MNFRSWSTQLVRQAPSGMCVRQEKNEPTEEIWRKLVGCWAAKNISGAGSYVVSCCSVTQCCNNEDELRNVARDGEEDEASDAGAYWNHMRYFLLHVRRLRLPVG